MTLNLKVLLLSSACILFAGVFGSFKSFQIQQNQRQDIAITQSQEISQWVASAIEQKLTQMEASVSYLDQSTIETLKRFGARYFAYAYKKGDGWSVKWKVIDKMGKDQILAEVNQVSYAEMPTTERSWVLLQDKLIYISPVELAESHQLKTGFLVFGMSDEFFGFLTSADKNMSLVDASGQLIHGRGVSKAHSQQLFSTNQSISYIREGATLQTSYFSSLAQAWVVRHSELAMASFLGSSSFVYGLFISALGVLALFLVLGPILGVVSLRPPVTLNTPSLGLGAVTNFFKRSADHQDQTFEQESLPVDSTERVIDDFGGLMDGILSDELGRLNKMGIQLKTQYVTSAKVRCVPQHIADLIQRLIGNSALTLDQADQKEIQIQLVEQQQAYQLIYVDTRSKNFPSGQEASLLLQSEDSLEGIDGIIAYASWLFGDSLTVAKKGFCLSVDLPKASETVIINSGEPVSEITSFSDSLERIEIDESDIDIEGFATIENHSTESAESTEESSVSFDDVIEQFRMKQFSFDESASESGQPDATEPQSVETDEKGFFEINSGDFKIKIRSPRKKGTDVDR